MAVAQFTQEFLANLSLRYGKTLKDFYNEMLIQTPTVQRIQFLSEYIDAQEDLLPKFSWSNEKDDEKSQQFREIGNKYFVKLEFIEALKYYNKALAFARTEQNLGVCYANRSAVYYELSLFQICLENIESARMYQLSDSLKLKLDERQGAAVSHLLSKLVYKPQRTHKMKLCRPPMQRQPFFINCLAKPTNSRIVTTEPLMAGDVISLEVPYSQVLSQSHIYERCTYCLTNKKYLSMIPCKHCTSAMFCNLNCYRMAIKMFHMFECSFIDGLYHFLPDSMYLGLRTVLISLTECNSSLHEYRSLLMRCFDNDADSFDVKPTSTNQSVSEMVFMIIHNLNRSFKFSMQHHVATAVLMGKLKLIFGSVFHRDPSTALVLSSSIFHMLHVSTENSVVLEETAFSGDGVGNDITIYGCGLFPFASNFKIQCSPNVLLLSSNTMLAGIAIRPIKAFEDIVVGIMSRNHFLTDRHRRTDRMLTINNELCHCEACRDDYELYSEMLPFISEFHNIDLPLIPERFANTKQIFAAFKLLCNYLNRCHYLPYLSRETGWCTHEMIRILRQLVEVHDTDVIFTEYSNLLKNV